MVRMDYFTAAWCNPCKMMKPVIAELQAAGWDITKIDVDQEPAKAQAAGVMAMPTFIIYKDDVPVRRITGARQKFTLESELRLVAGDESA